VPASASRTTLARSLADAPEPGISVPLVAET
jgi:hypothetical protein